MTSPEQAAGDGVDEKVNILIVDDRADKLLAHEVLLEELGQNLVKATSGKEALRCLLKQEFAVILLDVNMPGMDGFETAKMIRERPRTETTPIIFISAVNDTENHVSRGYSLGAVDYILTPVVPEILRAKINVFVDLYKKTEQVKRQAEERAKFIRAQAARAEAEAAQQRLAFLADASNVLAGSLDYGETFENLARLAVPRLADFCIIDVADESGTLRQVAVAHRDPGEQEKLRQLRKYYPETLDEKHGGARVFQTGKPEFGEITDETINSMFENEEARDFVRSLGAKCFVAVPLLARGRVLGAITLVNIDDARVCGTSEMALAEELAQRAALALDNAGLYQAAQKARTEAERANLAKDRFLAMLSHELRTPLTPVLTSLLAIEIDEVPEAIRPSLQMIRRNVELEARLIDDLLDLTRISKGKVQLSLEIVDAHVLLRSALEICQSDIDQKQLEVELDLAAERVALEADPARLQQIFWNLIKNAVKFTPATGKLRVRTRNNDEGLLCVEVSDSGVGIDAESLPKIFKAFEQGERAKLGGLGLGLAISKSLVETHNGRITAQSDGRDKGATFTAFFPVSDRQASADANGGDAPSVDRKSLRLLLVEDHEDTNRSLTMLLRRRGYEVEPATSVAAALDIAARYDFDVLVSDIGLPDGTGVDLIQRLRRDREVLGVALTGFGMEDDIQKSHDGGFRHHLIKPVDLNKLDAVIQETAATMPEQPASRGTNGAALSSS
ncbi:MAG: response regulator [Verrucomicrobiota bacterium]|nr:response regulator [Verrucomicrobiota bacterium]